MREYPPSDPPSVGLSGLYQEIVARSPDAIAILDGAGRYIEQNHAHALLFGFPDRELLGQRLVRDIDGQRLSGRIVETEAYIGPADTASHASKGRTARTAVMFGPPGYTYVYLIYGMYHMLNFTTEGIDFPAAVLIRALEPTAGIEDMQARRALENVRLLCSGPGRLCQALGVTDALDGRPVDRQPFHLELRKAPARVGVPT